RQAVPVPQARPSWPNKTGNVPAATIQAPTCGRSNNHTSPRIESQVSANPKISCVQSSGTPSAQALLVSQISESIGKQRNIEIKLPRLDERSDGSGCFYCSSVRRKIFHTDEPGQAGEEHKSGYNQKCHMHVRVAADVAEQPECLHIA